MTVYLIEIAFSAIIEFVRPERMTGNQIKQSMEKKGVRVLNDQEKSIPQKSCQPNALEMGSKKVHGGEREREIETDRQTEI